MNRPYRKPKSAVPPARARVLASWRGLDWEAVEKAWASPSRTPADLISTVFREARLEQRGTESLIPGIWAKVIDPTVKAHASPVGFARGTVFVQVDSDAWLSEIVRYRRKEILERLQLALGKELVKKISFRSAG